ncbi:HP0495 family protein [Legionella oakridgensis]|uniref:UPF0250 protein Loa_01654 n=2 Tax=Legionella oakridgensis TaxID=29423 RepID=W0BET1_9GAMM|nr:DUF493 domain-containing protein [Legionella oakridgensis]AHE67201.1 hypothetical protein Loa_01654 [Legionella oakridgensis ATCC 33761 = DSM 21215]ETO93165.1 hypothetical protein LOR_48c08970 [Legionella oakridgensis RV-2-2007]KTD38000.1 hypothetical protein Loak_1676 [Legionella oakridgensis]STY20278.1 putative lipoate regulatory protein YbeD [Legionella longbeachae]
MKKDQTLMQFPCDFPIKIIGINKETFLSEIITMTKKHFPSLENKAISTQFSQQGNYLSITITVYVQDQITLDALYMDLTQHPDIKMVL